MQTAYRRGPVVGKSGVGLQTRHNRKRLLDALSWQLETSQLSLSSSGMEQAVDDLVDMYIRPMLKRESVSMLAYSYSARGLCKFARSTKMGNAKASKCGTTNGKVLALFLYSGRTRESICHKKIIEIVSATHDSPIVKKTKTIPATFMYPGSTPLHHKINT